MNKFTIDIDETFKYHYRSLCLYVLHYVHDTDIAEDIVQVEKPLNFDPFGHAELSLFAKI